MGRNNRARRQQKQRNKQKKQKTAASAKRQALIQVDELFELCHPVVVSLANGEPPPPSIMADWAASPIPPAAKPLRTLLISFIDYLFHGYVANGEVDSLTPQQRTLKRADLAWLYPLLFAYCLISDKALAEGDVEALTHSLHQESLWCDVGGDCHPQNDVLCAPFYLTLWLMGCPVPSQGGLRVWLRHWLGDSPWRPLIPPLEKFLRLKSPKPQQKTVKALERALSDMDGNRHDEWQDGIGRLLGLFLQQRLSVAQRNTEAWRHCPQIAALSGLVETPATTHWQPLRFEETNTATLNRLNRQVATDTMPYVERLPLEALKCRLLSRYVEKNGGGRQDFERQLGHLLNLMSRGVPPDDMAFAERCLESTCEWLAEEVGQGHFPPPAAERLRRLYRCRPSDYRVALLLYLATQGREPALNSGKDNSEKDNSGKDTHFQYIHFPLFFQALRDAIDAQDFLERFYWPLTGEPKKALFTQCCRKLFLGMDEYDAKQLWGRWRQPLFDVNREPFAAIVKGQACEAEALFYITLAAVDTSYGTTWLQADHLSSLVRSAADLLEKHASDFNQSNVVNLLNSLTASQYADNLFHLWEPVLTITRHIEDAEELQVFLRLALRKLNDQADRLSNQYHDLTSLCRQIPTLRQYLPRKPKATSRKKAQKTSPSATLDLFGDLS